MFVHRHSEGKDQFDAVMATVRTSPELVKLGKDGRGEDRFTSRSMIETERRLENATIRLDAGRRHGVPERMQDAALARAEQRGLVMSPEQRGAFEHVTGSRGLSSVIGYAGTGKSAMLGVAREAIALMVYSFSRIGAALAMKREDVFVQGRRLWVRLHEKGGKRHAMPCHHLLDEYLTAYMEASDSGNARAPLFRTLSRRTRQLGDTQISQADAFTMVYRRAQAAGIATKIGNHTFRATWINTYLKNGGTLENAAVMAGHASTRTTQLYDRRSEDITLAEVERVRL
ncbi:tyrosine-type recombinase/integrase [Novosphingobium sp. BL-52-GroH]|uniref:tyrosine-type recombinase/integrase n=1 Tax=Novosphingobium sp. BL-52-GroH TaxID=3349877 RepID=UPI00384B6D5C